jgi:hypothetical protein
VYMQLINQKDIAPYKAGGTGHKLTAIDTWNYY